MRGWWELGQPSAALNPGVFCQSTLKLPTGTTGHSDGVGDGFRPAVLVGEATVPKGDGAGGRLDAGGTVAGGVRVGCRVGVVKGRLGGTAAGAHAATASKNETVRTIPPARGQNRSFFTACLQNARRPNGRGGVQTGLVFMAVLYASDEADFLFLTNATGLTKGNLSAHVAKLEEVGYVTVTKSYNGKIPHTAYALTRRGRAAFARYHKDLSEITRRVGKARQ